MKQPRFRLRSLLILVAIVALAAYWLKPERLDLRCFPIGDGYRWVYASAGGEDVTFEVVGRRVIDGADCYVVDRTIGEHTVTFYVEANRRGVFIHQVGKDRYLPAYQQFAFPTREGAKWEWRGTIGGEPAGYNCTNLGRTQVQSPLGEWDAWFVDQSWRGGTDFYLAKGVGVVRIRSKNRDQHDPPAAEGEPASFDWRLKEFSGR